MYYLQDIVNVDFATVVSGECRRRLDDVLNLATVERAQRHINGGGSANAHQNQRRHVASQRRRLRYQYVPQTDVVAQVRPSEHREQ